MGRAEQEWLVMAVIVPRVSQGGIGPSGASISGGGGPNVTAAGLDGGVSSALMQASVQLFDIQQREQAKADAAQANAARVALSQQEVSLFDPNNQSGVYSYQGAKALQAPGAVQQLLDTWATKYRSGLANPRQQALFDQIYGDHRAQLLDRVNRYALGENDRYQTEAYQGAVGSAMSAATTKAAAGDMDGANLALNDGIATIHQYAQAHGEAPEQTAFKIEKFKTTVMDGFKAANKANAEAYILQNPGQAMQDLSARLGLGRYSPAGQVAAGDPSAPRGVRNNNPGNLQQSGVQWQGKVSSADPRYEAFATPEEGIRALALNAQHLQANGAQTVADLIGKWAPAQENGAASTQAYVGAVSKAMGVSPDAPINLQDPGQLLAFTNAVISHENGGDPASWYKPEQVKRGVDAALGLAKLPDSHPAVTTNGSGMIVPANGDAPKESGQLGHSGNPMIDNLDTGSVVDLYNRARAEVNRGQTELRGSIDQRERDDTAAFRAGQGVAQPLTLADYTRAYGDREGMQRFGAYQADQQLGHDLQTVTTLDPQQMNDLLAARAPAAGENFAVKNQDHGILQRAIEQTLTARQADPVKWARGAGVGGFQPLDLSSPDALAGSIAARTGPARSIADQFGAPYRLMSADESKALATAFNQFGAGNKAAALGAMAAKLAPVDYAQVIATLKPDSPVTARAGQIMASGRYAVTKPGGMFHDAHTMDASTIAQTMLAGDALINPTKADKEDNGAAKFAMPSDSATSGLRSAWNTVVGDAFRGDGAGEVQAYQAYRAMYAGLAAKAGKSDGVYDEDLAQKAARATIGNVGDWNGHAVIPPYGMDTNTFKDAVTQQWKAVRESVPGAADDPEAYDLDEVGDGAYTLSSGGAPVRNESGAPVVLRIAAASGQQVAQALADQRKAKETPDQRSADAQKQLQQGLLIPRATVQTGASM
jgi:hypothetical protein